MPIEYRPGTPADTYAAYQVFEIALSDFAARRNFELGLTPGDPQGWEREGPLYEHLGRTADQFWLAELDGQLIGFARSILRDGARELTDFFVLPTHQSAGVGRQLLARAFPADGTRHRSIIATSDSRALGRYLRAGLHVRFPIYYFGRPPEALEWQGTLVVEPITSLASAKDDLNQLDGITLGYEREVDHGWLLSQRKGFIYRRDGRAVGYGYTGQNNGPFALLESTDYPAVLAHAETQAAERGANLTGFEVPLLNHAAVDYLLKRRFMMEPFFAFYMSDAEIGRLENYIVMSPPYFL